jgi:NADH-quinone oxidoreductase subunit G
MCNIETVLDRVRAAQKANGEPAYHFIEVMACRGGCVGGGGQPYGADDEVRRKRAAGLYKDDRECARRCSHENEEVQAIYTDFLGSPLSAKAHHYLHNQYEAKLLYRK